MAFKYNAPSFVDFTSEELAEKEEAEKFFIVGELAKLSIKKQSSEGEVDNNTGAHDESSSEEECVQQTKEDQEENCESSNGTGNENILKERNTQNAENDMRKRKFGTLTPTSKTEPVKFISLAEGVENYQKCLTNRFYSQQFKSIGRRRKSGSKQNFVPHVTIPQSPHLLTKNRTRPVDYPTAQEREEKLVQEIQSYKLKANPINEKIFKEPTLGTRALPKKATVIEPFTLTEFKKKELHSEEGLKPFIFKASKIPEGLLEHCIGVPDKTVIPATQAVTPSFLRQAKYKRHINVVEEVDGKNVVVRKDIYHTGIVKSGNCLLTKTEVKPFSFEERDKQLQKSKEEKIKKILEEEKKAREFHAKPLPRYMKSRLNSTCGSPTPSVSSTHSESSIDENNTVKFKARPADVIHKKPFVPKKAEQPALEPLPIQLNTEIRAKERKKFDEEMKRELQARDAILLHRKEEQEKLEQEEIARLRKENVHKATKIRSYKPLPEAIKKPLTDAESPCFVKKA